MDNITFGGSTPEGSASPWYKAHIPPLGVSGASVTDETSARREKMSRYLRCAADVAVDGSVVQLTVDRPDWSGDFGGEPPGVFVEPPGRLSVALAPVDGQVFSDGLYGHSQGVGGDPVAVRRGGGRRGVVSDFSRQSRRRLQALFCSVPRSGFVPSNLLFVTLTYHHSWGELSKDWKADLDAFRKRLYRKYGEFPAIWRLEFQKRGAPHFHLLMFPPVGLLPPISDDEIECEFMFDVIWFWNGLVAPGDLQHALHGISMQQASSWRGAMYYLSKYASKVEEVLVPSDTLPGRVWGIWKKGLLGITWRRWNLEYVQYIKLRRVFRRKCGYRRGRGAETGVVCFLEWSAFLRLAEYMGLSPPVS
jgi:hypothetical protein